MATGNQELIDFICCEIRAEGTISFARFMELALYQPALGYYASGRAKIGRRGDYFTNVSVGPIFGRLLAAQFAEIWQLLGRPDAFHLVEQGAHNGTLAADVMSALRVSSPDCFRALEYGIVEPFPVWRERQQKKLNAFSGKVTWAAAPTDLKPIIGVFFANELFDALPVHLLSLARGSWKELFVNVSDNRFFFEERSWNKTGSPPPTPPTDQPYRTEVNVAAPELMRQMAEKLERGVFLTIDYGYAREDYYSAARREGALRVRASQKTLASPFDQIGQADLSAHVEWTSLLEASGLELLGFTDQTHFLTGVVSELLLPDEMALQSAGDKRGLQTLLHPEMLGRSFQVMVLGKDFAHSLSGLRFAGKGNVLGASVDPAQARSDAV